LLNYGQYFIALGADFPMQRVHYAIENALTFQIAPTGGVGGHIPDGRRGLLRIQLPWCIEPLAPGSAGQGPTGHGSAACL
jgi:hypothetical protein